jgi:hypothetical protein
MSKTLHCIILQIKTNPDPSLGQAQKYGVKPVNEISTFFS